MNVCSPIALNAISSENELIVYIEMMRTGGQTKTGTKRKRRKKRSGISIRWDRKESKIDECRSNQRACARTWTQQTRKKRPSTSLEMVFGGKKTHHQIGVRTHWKCEHSQIETVIFQVFQSIRYLTWIIFTISQWVEQKNVPFFIMSCHLSRWKKESERNIWNKNQATWNGWEDVDLNINQGSILNSFQLDWFR